MTESNSKEQVRAVYRAARELKQSSPTLARADEELRASEGIVSPDGSLTRAELGWAAKELALMRSDRVLDLACGTGAIARALAGGYRCRVAGMDLLRERVATGQQAANGEGLDDAVYLAQGDAAWALPFAASAFDSLLMLDALIHIRDRAALFGEMERVLKMGGRLLICTVAGTQLSEQEAQILEETTASFFRFTLSELLSQLAEARLGVRVLLDRTARLREWHARREGALRALEKPLREELSADGWERLSSRERTTVELLRAGRLTSVLLVGEKEGNK